MLVMSQQGHSPNKTLYPEMILALGLYLAMTTPDISSPMALLIVPTTPAKVDDCDPFLRN